MKDETKKEDRIMSEPAKKEDRTAAIAKKLDEDKEELEVRNTLFAAKGKSTVPARAPISDEQYRDDVLRRVNRRSHDNMQTTPPTIEEKGHVITVTMPNKLKVRLTINDDTPVPETITRAHIVRWEAVG
jgi:hypothetical protein